MPVHEDISGLMHVPVAEPPNNSIPTIRVVKVMAVDEDGVFEDGVFY